ncbi:MAG TPA: hypothetical protein VEG60_20705 [Candidatus Binatia bacterium]|nr:hypothetical protein [Candidatus Binatia bacterium]
MNASSPYRHAPSLLAGVALLLSCFLFSGCRLDLFFGYANLKDLIGENLDQFPAIVLSTDNPGDINYTFDWTTTSLAGMKASDFKPTEKFWRLNIFSFKDGGVIGNFKRQFEELETHPSVTFPSLPQEKLLRIDLDLAEDEDGTKGRKTYSFLVLFHYE